MMIDRMKSMLEADSFISSYGMRKIFYHDNYKRISVKMVQSVFNKVCISLSKQVKDA